MMSVQRIAITPSVRLAMSLCVAHIAAGGAVWLALVPLWLKAALALAIAISLVYCLSRAALLRAAEAVVALEISDGRISFQTRRGEWHECELLGSSYVSPRLTIVNLKLPGARRVRHVVLVPDNVDAGDFRRLRTWLRWAAQPDTTRNRESV
jgi:toxin CptA